MRDSRDDWRRKLDHAVTTGSCPECGQILVKTASLTGTPPHLLRSGLRLGNDHVDRLSEASSARLAHHAAAFSAISGVSSTSWGSRPSFTGT
jgi:hypothetical protein